MIQKIFSWSPNKIHPQIIYVFGQNDQSTLAKKFSPHRVDQFYFIPDINSRMTIFFLFAFSFYLKQQKKYIIKGVPYNPRILLVVIVTIFPFYTCLRILGKICWENENYVQVRRANTQCETNSPFLLRIEDIPHASWGNK